SSPRKTTAPPKPGARQTTAQHAASLTGAARRSFARKLRCTETTAGNSARSACGGTSAGVSALSPFVKLGRWLLVVGAIASGGGCGASGPWTAQPSPPFDESYLGDVRLPQFSPTGTKADYRVHSIGRLEPESPVENPEVLQTRIKLARSDANIL